MKFPALPSHQHVAASANGPGISFLSDIPEKTCTALLAKGHRFPRQLSKTHQKKD